MPAAGIQHPVASAQSGRVVLKVSRSHSHPSTALHHFRRPAAAASSHTHGRYAPIAELCRPPASSWCVVAGRRSQHLGRGCRGGGRGLCRDLYRRTCTSGVRISDSIFLSLLLGGEIPFEVYVPIPTRGAEGDGDASSEDSGPASTDTLTSHYGPPLW